MYLCSNKQRYNPLNFYDYEEDDVDEVEDESIEDVEDDDDEESWKVYSPALLTTSDFTNGSISLQDKEDESLNLEPIETERDATEQSAGAEATHDSFVEHDREPEVSIEETKEIETVALSDGAAQTKLFDLSKIQMALANTHAAFVDSFLHIFSVCSALIGVSEAFAP